jgi:hypothetical protein
LIRRESVLGQNTTDIADTVCQVLIDARVDLVLVMKFII